MNSKLDILLVWGLSALGTAPILLVDYMPSHDGPAHVYLAQVLRLFDDTPLFRAYFSENWNFQPNLFAYALLQPLLSLLTPAAAEKALAILYVLLIPCTTIGFADALRQSRLIVFLLLWPMLYGFMFFFGFYNFCFSLLFTLIGMSLWMRLCRSNSYSDMIALGLVSLAAYFTHIFPAANLLLIIGVGTLANTFHIKAKESFRAQLSQLFAAAWRPAIALLPVYALIVHFVAGNTEYGLSPDSDYGFFARLTHLALLSFNLAYAPLDMVFSIALLIVFGAVYLKRDRGAPSAPNRLRGLSIALMVVYGVLFFALPTTLAGSTFVLDRLLPFLYLSLALFIVCASLNHRQRRFLVFGLLVIGVYLPIYRSYQFYQLDKFMAPFHQIQATLPRNHTILVVQGAAFPAQSLLWRPDFRVNTLLHASAMVAAENNLVDLKLVQANTHKTPLRYRDAKNPYWFLPANQPEYPAKAALRTIENLRLEAATPDLDFTGYEMRSRGHVDYLLVWGPVDAYENTLAGIEFLENVSRQFLPVEIGKGADYLRLYKSHSEM